MKPLFKILITCIAASFAGYLAAASFGKGLAGPSARAVENFARFENIRLPIGARTEHQLKSFIVRMKEDVDDFGRVYINNRQVTSTESPARPFRSISWKEADEDYPSRFVVERANPTAAEVDVRKWLRKGTNWIMVELENSRWGACSMTVEFLANGIQLEGSPYFMPQQQQIDVNLSNLNLLQRFRELSHNTIEKGAFGIIPENDAVCDRSVLAFELD
jgi:hypothetical protein